MKQKALSENPTSSSPTMDPSLLSSINLLPKNFEHNYEEPSETMKKARARSSVDMQRLKDLFMNPMLQEFWDKTHELIKNDPHMTALNPFEHSKRELREQANYIFTKTWKNLNYDYDSYKKDPMYMMNAMLCTGVISMSAGTKVGVHFGLYTKTLLSLGTKKHEELVRRAFTLEDYGCFMLTEMGHGSNVQGTITTATYDHSSRSFILNTSVDSGMKFWIGNLAETANYGVAFANLIINGRNEGVHAFVVKLRDDNGNVSPGILIGDCGTKMGNNGVDNGWALFRSMRIPYENLLDRFSQVDSDGKFRSKIKSKTKRFAVQISALSGGRVGVGMAASSAGIGAGLIALRYTTVRKQFGEKKGMENVLMDYPLVHSKLVTHMANGMMYFDTSFFLDREWMNVDPYNLKDIKVKELHSLSSFIKVAASWNMKKATSTARELCGGHGYSSYSYLPTLICNTEVHVTWEGTNEVLLQQTCKNLLEEFNKFKTKNKIDYVHLQFLKDFEDEKVDIGANIEEIKAFAEDILTGDFSSHIKENKGSQQRLSVQEAIQMSQRLDKALSAFQVLLELRLYQMVDKALGKFAQFLTQIKSTKDNFFKSFNKSLPHVLFPTAIFFGELFCFKLALYNLSFIGKNPLAPVLFKEKPHFGQKKIEEFIYEKIFLQKLAAIFATSTLANSAVFLLDSHEDVEYELFDSLNDIQLRITETLRYDLLSKESLINEF